MPESIEYYDITPEISEKLVVWPGDQNFERHLTADFQSGSNILLSSIRATLHLGAHTDAPNHYHPQGKGIESRNLNYYIGRCQVISVSLPRGQRILPTQLSNVEIKTPRILFKTGSFPNPEIWNDDFNSLSASLVEYLHRFGVILVGIDTPSVDLFHDKILEAHHSIYDRDMAILEGIILNQVPDGEYELIALPLKIKNADASPVRAILIPVERGAP